MVNSFHVESLLREGKTGTFNYHYPGQNILIFTQYHFGQLINLQ